MKFKFIGEFESIPFQNEIASRRKIEFEAEDLSDIIEQFEMFLRGCGYTINGSLGIVEDEIVRILPETESAEEDNLDDIAQFFNKVRGRGQD